ncbi:MAG TPA: isoprenylcysteine carboxylmethyltransferase family protein [Beijerinckiaceae bacterium]|jgi:protein-S-isoprenylcysteine O-methyltransferase Ste14|nr:putative conserved integral rane protein [Microvirga sp.]HZB38375.1 isoprenylcysteine carboxylmethyltransferase family protein [Beijerinckiaceae bacterium]
MARFASLLYGGAAYGVFFLTFLYAVGFVSNLGVPKGIDDGRAAPLAHALIVDTLLLGLFAIQHSVMARPAFKRIWTKIVPSQIERSTFVLFASLALILLFWQWRPMPAPIWTVESPIAAGLLQAASLAGWGLVLVSTFLISHFELFGLKQVALHWLRRPTGEPEFRTPSLYRVVRHPIYLGFLMAFWAAPVMSEGHLLFALATTGYILVGIRLEERDLIAMFGAQYEAYRRRVAMLVPGIGPRAKRSDPPLMPFPAER